MRYRVTSKTLAQVSPTLAHSLFRVHKLGAQELEVMPLLDAL